MRIHDALAARHPVMLLALLMGAGIAFHPAGPARAQVGPATSYFEIDGDYGDALQDLYQGDGAGYLPSLDVILQSGLHSWGRRQTPCDSWAHTTLAPYMGLNSYRTHCVGAGPQRRSEQMILSDWVPDAGDSQRYFTFAFRLVDVPEAPLEGTRGFLAQLHQGGSHPVPFRMQWEYLCPPDSAECRYYATMGVRWGVDLENNTFQEFGPALGGGRAGIPLSPGEWHRMLFRISLVPDPEHAPCPGTGEVQAWLMNPQTGGWDEVAHYSGPLGMETPSCDFQWKVGLYANNTDLITVDYDNVAYGKRWNDITKNRLVGYGKTVMDLWCDDGAGTLVRDRSYSRNGGLPSDPVADYDNDGTIVGSAQWNVAGVAHGGSLHFNGSSYVAVPMDEVDFDFGNYVTAACWFRTSVPSPSNVGLLVVDEFSSTYKVKLTYSDTILSFGVRFTDGSHASVNHGFPAGTYADGEWHHAIGTFNRFAPDGQRLALYIDGVNVLRIPGSDLPLLRGEDRIVVGKYGSSGFFSGDIDEVLLRNFAMSEGQVEALYAESLPPTGVMAPVEDDPRSAVTVLGNPGGPAFTLRLSLPSASRAALSIFDAGGRVVARPFEGHAEAGQHEATWDGRDHGGTPLPASVYYYRWDSAGRRVSGPLVLVR